MNIDIYHLLDESQIHINKLEKKGLLGRASVNFGNLGINVRGFIIGKTNDGTYWSSPPSFGRSQGSNKNLYILWFDDNDVWAYLKKKIINQYISQFEDPGMMTDKETDDMVDQAIENVK